MDLAGLGEKESDDLLRWFLSDSVFVEPEPTSAIVRLTIILCRLPLARFVTSPPTHEACVPAFASYSLLLDYIWYTVSYWK